METLKIGIAGLGTVGAATLGLLEANKELIARRAGRAVEIAGISARNRSAKRSVDITPYPWFDNPADMLETCNVLVELIGGADGIAYKLVRAALAKGVHVVTANKALIAHHGLELAGLAEENKCSLMYEAAVAGAVPVVGSLRQSLSANAITAVHGILNGTCNYILTQMRETGRPFADVLKEAQAKGYAEADPTFDVEGIDAGHKIAILASLAFGTQPDFQAVHMTGISSLTEDDFKFASELGYKIKLLGSAINHDARVLQIVEPCFVPGDSPFAAIENAYNAVFCECSHAETPLMSGLGAGGDATASSVVGDLIGVARGDHAPVFGVPAAHLTKAAHFDPREVESRYYVRFSVLDRVGVMADISAILRDHGISIETMLQHGRAPGQDVNVVIVTHDTLRDDINMASELISRLDVSSGEPCIIRIEDNF